eukprot:TRINITY_DN51551_c0_g2_i1.p1 TRINITY_DN51551_c0_g2~~TRINITY_DN51551_c0_g2_i1.p1  ORF type:complete len:200 (-),score=39.21 TRINITY_DN51551_c0_g2_i1:53-652(-)
MGASGSSDAASDVPVVLHVYDFHSTKSLNSALRHLGTGVYHVGIEVHGVEYTFEKKLDSEFRTVCETGVSFDKPKANTAYSHREALPLGYTRRSESEVQQIVTHMAAKWSSEDYDILHCNCCHFCDAFSKQLGVQESPPWLKSAAQMGSQVLLSDFGLLASATSCAQEDTFQMREYLDTDVVSSPVHGSCFGLKPTVSL